MHQKDAEFTSFVSAFPEIQLDDNQLELLKARYFLPGETWKDVAARVAWAIAQGSVEYKDRNVVDEAKEYFDLIYNMHLMPSTPFLMNAGARKQNLFACYVLDIDDTLESIYDMLGMSAKIFAAAGGCGYNFGNLRPTKTQTNLRNEASGVLSFMQLFDASCATIKAGSSGRRGAMLAALPVDHPEILEFIKCKENNKALNNFNISVLINDEFMAAVRLGGEYKLREFKNYDGPKTMDARKVYKALVRSAWKNGEPGIIFIDTANRYNPVPSYGKICATNPCLHGDTLISTTNGNIPIKILAEGFKPFSIKNSHKDFSSAIAWYTGDKQCIKLTLDNDTTLICTPDHKITVRVEAEPFDYYEDIEAWTAISRDVVTEVGLNQVVKIEGAGIHPVYDFSEPITNHGWANGILVHNCGEVVGIRDSVCCLAHVNFSKLVKGNDMDWVNMEKQIRSGIRFLDNAIDCNHYIDKRFEKTAKNTRQIGLGFMGLADAMTKLHIRYGSPESIEFCEKLGSFFQNISHDESEQIAKTRGVYPKFEGKTPLRRNSVTNTIAPTGCQRGDTLVITDNGILKLDEIVSDNIQNIRVSQDTKTELMSRYFINGVAPTKKITLHSGIELEATYNHKYRVVSESGDYLWKRVDELIVGDNLVTRLGGYNKRENPPLKQLSINHADKRFNHITQPTHMTPMLAAFVGLLLADGSIHKNCIRVHMAKDEEFTERILRSMVRFLFNIDINTRIERTCKSVYISSSELIEFLRINGLLKDKSFNVKIPKVIRQSSRRSLEKFIYGYWLGDGYLGNGNIKVIDSVSKQFIQELSVVWRAIGWNTCIQIHTCDDSHKGSLVSYRVRQVNYGSIGNSEDKIKKIKRHIRATLASVRKYGAELCFDKVCSIEDSECMTYDIEVPIDNCYLANSFVSHNSVGMLANASYGIEPHFALSYVKNCAEGRKFQYDNVDLIEQLGKVLTKEDLEEVRATGQLPDRLFKDNQQFITANQIPHRERIRVQAAWQKHIDLSISSTINLPETATRDEVADIYMTAWEKGLKGLTLYRNNSRSAQVLNVKDVKHSYVCNSCGHIIILEEEIDPEKVCIKCPSCGFKSCA